MKYQALYRKYRPFTFDDVFGQDFIIKTLKNSVKENKFTHAYLFCGPRGTGKTSVAKLLAKAVNCENLKDGYPCEKCDPCKQIANKTTSDIIEIDAASNNGVDEIREIRNKVNLVPSECKYKIYIIDEVHMLSTGAFNALLKTLEEPPAHVIFILATTEAHKVPMTIISRCQRFDFKKIDINKMVSKINKIVQKEKIKIDDDAVKEIARLADGSLRDAEGILDKLVSYTNNNIKIEDVYMLNGTATREKIVELITYLNTNNTKQLLELIDEFDNNGKDLFKIIEDLMKFLRDYLIYKKTPEYFLSDKEMFDFYGSVKINLNESDIYRLIQILNETNNQMHIANNPKIIFEVSLLGCDINNNITNTSTNKMVEEKNKKIEEKKEEQNINDSDQIDFEKFENIRINNILVCAEKKELKRMQNEWKNIKSYAVDSKYGPIVGMLIDSEVKAAGENRILITFKYEAMADRVNKNIYDIEIVLAKLLNGKYKIIAITEDEWEKVKEEYIKKKKNGEVYKIMDEPKIEKVKNTNKNDEGTDDFLKMTVGLFGESVVEVD